MIIGLDVGGTHTDTVLLDQNGLVKESKVPTDTSNLFHSVLTGLDQITQDVDPAGIKRIVLSTTLTTNAIIQNKIQKVGVIVMSGPGISPEVFQTNEFYFPVRGSMDHRGREIMPVDEEEIHALATRFKNDGIHHVGVIGKFSTRNPAHELAIEKILAPSVEKVFLGHLISGNLNFPRRVATTYLNAAVYDVHRGFFEAVKKSLVQKGLTVPIHILKADGGTMNFDSSIDFPGQSILSGPAASVMGAIASAPLSEDILVLDIGGTTTDMAILINRVPVLEPLGIEIKGYKTLIRALQNHSIGIGGDSAVHVVNGALEIGPERLGPAMGHGGPVPTPTDALLVLNEMMEGDREKAVNGMKSIAANIGETIEETAKRIMNQASQRIVDEARDMVSRINSKPFYTVHELLEGYRVAPQKVLVLGGPAQFFAKYIGVISDYDIKTVPNFKVANAIGAALARTTCEVNLFADTSIGMAFASEENYAEKIGRTFTRKDALEKAFDLLREKALKSGAQPDDLPMEILEESEFNMIRGFHTAGKNIRVKVQVKPGLIKGYADMVSP